MHAPAAHSARTALDLNGCEDQQRRVVGADGRRVRTPAPSAGLRPAGPHVAHVKGLVFHGALKQPEVDRDRVRAGGPVEERDGPLPTIELEA